MKNKKTFILIIIWIVLLIVFLQHEKDMDYQTADSIGYLIMGMPLLFTIQFIFGIISIFTSLFSALFVFVSLGIYLLFREIDNKYGLPKNLVFSLSQVALWLSLIFFGKTFLYIYNSSVGGFPWRAFAYPSGAMGRDVPPFEMWPKFYLNYVFWIFASFFLVIALKDKKIEQKYLRNFFIFSIITEIFGFGYILFRFD